MMDGTGPGRIVQGAMTALVTPFCKGLVDWTRLESLIERQIGGGIDWLVPCGTTGETPTLSKAECRRLVETVTAHANGRCGIMVGTGSNNTATAVSLTKDAADAGAHAALVVAPYYNRPTQEGLFRHFAAIAERVDIPIVLYNVPPRTGVHIGNGVVIRLRERFPHVVAIKHATGNLDGVTELMRDCDIKVISGDDPLNWPLMAIGAVGTISVVSNLCPSLVKSQTVAALEGDHSAAAKHHRTVSDLATALGRIGPNPLPIKTAMAIVGLLEEEFRLPLCRLDAEAHSRIESLLERHGFVDTVPV